MPILSFCRDRRQPHCTFQWCSGSHWASSKSLSIIKSATSLAVQHEIVGRFWVFWDLELLASCSLQQERERNPPCHLCLAIWKRTGEENKRHNSQKPAQVMFSSPLRECVLYVPSRLKCSFQPKVLIVQRLPSHMDRVMHCGLLASDNLYTGYTVSDWSVKLFPFELTECIFQLAVYGIIMGITVAAQSRFLQ